MKSDDLIHAGRAIADAGGVTIGVAIGAPAAIAVGAILTSARWAVNSVNTALIFMVLVVAVAALGGRAAGAITAVASVMSYDFFHTEPYLSMAIESRDDIETTVLLLVAGLLVGTIASKGRSARHRETATRVEVRRVHRVAEATATGRPPMAVLDVAQDEITALLDLADCWFEPVPYTDDADAAAPGPQRCDPSAIVLPFPARTATAVPGSNCPRRASSCKSSPAATTSAASSSSPTPTPPPPSTSASSPWPSPIRSAPRGPSLPTCRSPQRDDVSCSPRWRDVERAEHHRRGDRRAGQPATASAARSAGCPQCAILPRHHGVDGTPRCFLDLDGTGSQRAGSTACRTTCGPRWERHEGVGRSDVAQRWVLGERIEEGVGPSLGVAFGGEAVVEDPSRVHGRVASDVVPEQEVGEQYVTALGEQWFTGAEPGGWVEHDRMTAHCLECVDAVLVKQLLVATVRAWPDPQVAAIGCRLVGEEDRRQHRERADLLVGAVSVDVRGAGSMRVGRDVQGYLDVVESVIEVVRRDELVGEAERTRVAQRGVGRWEPVRWEEVEVRTDGPRRSGRPDDEFVDLDVGGS